MNPQKTIDFSNSKTNSIKLHSPNYWFQFMYQINFSQVKLSATDMKYFAKSKFSRSLVHKYDK